MIQTKFTNCFIRETEKAMAPHSSTLGWKIPWMEEPGSLQSVGSRRVRHDWMTSLSLFTFMHWRRKWQPTPVFLPGGSQGWGSLWAGVYGVTQSQTRLKRLSSSSSNSNLCLSLPLGKTKLWHHAKSNAQVICVIFLESWTLVILSKIMENSRWMRWHRVVLASEALEPDLG